MKTVLCYGDSNTWGYNPRGGRFDHSIRWPAVMASLLNPPGIIPGMPGSASPAFWVVEEGLNGRTTCLEDPIEGDRNGLRQLIPILRSHRPLDLVIVMLGTNDLKRRFNPSPYEISHGAQLVAKAALSSECGPGDGQPKVLLVCPAPITKAEAFAQIISPDAFEISRKMAAHYKACAKECGAAFFDAGEVISASSPADGIHWEADDHRNFAKAMAEQVRKLLES
ncbi:MAG: SGNH/GDSL hydrolase family protein [Treponema sp.]|nr:SGNH/GDSL hydrolase family protein [Treponema sp.]